MRVSVFMVNRYLVRISLICDLPQQLPQGDMTRALTLCHRIQSRTHVRLHLVFGLRIIADPPRVQLNLSERRPRHEKSLLRHRQLTSLLWGTRTPQRR